MSSAIRSFQNKIAVPLPFVKSLPYFILPAVVLFFAFNTGVPYLLRLGLSPFMAYFFPVCSVLCLMLAASFVLYHLEGNPWKKQAFINRLRLQRLSAKDWLWLLLAVLVSFILMGLFGALNSLLLKTGIMNMPAWLPDFLNPLLTENTTQEGMLAIYEMAFGGLRGNWLGLAAYYFLIAVNIIGEEFWWRGIVLPRQEAAHGKWAWLYHGSLWWLFHSFKWWGLLPILPVTLILSWVVQKTGKTQIGIYLHLIVNGIGLIPLTLITAGLI